MTWTSLAHPVVVAAATTALLAGQAAAPVALLHDPVAGRVDVTLGGRPFTTYQYGAAFVDKPVFYPIISPNGARINREYPMVTGVAGESNDHPHHQSLFFTYDEVNGTNFWNPEQTGRRIVQRQVTIDGASFTAVLEWRDKDGLLVLEETKRVTFGGGPDVFWLDHDSTLQATRVPVTMGDTKEGAFGLRVNDTLKEAGGTGRYVNAEGLETEAGVWGKPSRWVALRGAVKDQAGSRDVTVAMYAHPASLNAPPYWHARAYGLFAANPFARQGYDPSQPKRLTTLAVGDKVRVRLRLAVYSGQVDTARLERDYAAAAR